MICTKCKREVQDGPYCSQCGAKQERVKASPRRGNGEGNAYKRGKTWTGRAAGYTYAERQPDGTIRTVRKRPTKGGFKTKRDALLWAAQATPERSDKAPTLAELWSGWSENDMLKLSDSKQAAYRIARQRLEPIIARPIDELTVDELQSTVNSQAGSYYTARDMKNLLSHLYKRAMASNTSQNRVTVNLARFLVLPALEESESIPFTRDEVAALWASYGPKNAFAGYILLMIYTGMMPAELLSCRKDMVDLDRCEIVGAGKKTKTRKAIPIVFPAFLRPVVEDLLAAESPNGRADNGKLLPISKDRFYPVYYAALDAAGVRRLPPYSCRHTYGTEAVKSGASPAVVQQMLRHASQSMQQRYTHLSPDYAHAAAEELYHK